MSRTIRNKDWKRKKYEKNVIYFKRILDALEKNNNVNEAINIDIHDYIYYNNYHYFVFNEHRSEDLIVKAQKKLNTQKDGDELVFLLVKNYVMKEIARYENLIWKSKTDNLIAKRYKRDVKKVTEYKRRSAKKNMLNKINSKLDLDKLDDQYWEDTKEKNKEYSLKWLYYFY